MLFKYIYSAFVVCSTIYTVQNFGLAVTPRQLLSVIMFVACLIHERKLWTDKFFNLYLIFVLCYGLSCLFNGYETVFIKRLIGDYFVAYTAYWSTKIIVKENRRKYLTVPLFITVGFNAVVSYFQLIGNNFFQPFLDYFQLIGDQRFYYYMERDLSLMGKVTFGIYSSPVVSGHMLMYVAVLSLILQQKRLNLWGFFFTFILMVGSFATQERTGFYAAFFFILFLVYMRINYNTGSKKYVVSVFFILTLILILPFLYSELMGGESRFAQIGIDSTGRDKIYAESFEYFLEYPLLGNYHGYLSSHEYPPHNMLLSSLLYSGIVGTIFILAITLLQIRIIMLSVYRFKKYGFLLLTLSMSYLSIFVNGLTHNMSIANGDINCWLIWGVTYYTYLDKREFIRRTTITDILHSKQ